MMVLTPTLRLAALARISAIREGGARVIKMGSAPPWRVWRSPALNSVAMLMIPKPSINLRSLPRNGRATPDCNTLQTIRSTSNFAFVCSYQTKGATIFAKRRSSRVT